VDQDKDRDQKYLEVKWTAVPQESRESFLENRRRIEKWIAPQWSEKMNLEYGITGTEGAYTPEHMYNDPELVMQAQERGEEEPVDVNRAPLTTDMVQFVVWLRENTDFFSGPDLDIKFPRADDPKFHEVLAHLALLYTEE
jgi:hypothetical protein